MPFYLPAAPNIQEKYSYIIKYPILLKILYIIGLLSGGLVLYGFINFFAHNIWYWIFFAPIVFYLALYQTVSTCINLFYKKFDVQKHDAFKEKFWNRKKKPPVIDIFLPVCGEDIRILENTWWGIMTMKNELKYKLSPVVLDDVGDPAVEELARRHKFRYLSRPNKWEMKKAGNLKYGFENTKGDFIVVFDADFKPRYDFIEDLLPYMSDAQIWLVQSPQFFDYDKAMHKRSWLQYGAGNIQNYFYSIIQRSRDTFGGAICVGSCAIYRRKALKSIWWTVQVEHSEDVHTWFRLVTHGWKLKYIPLVLSKGVCPSDLISFFKQQIRWCSGSMNLLCSVYFWKSRIPLMMRVCYLSWFMYYLSNPTKLLLVIQTFFLFTFHRETVGVESLIIFVPTISVALLLQWIYIYPRARIGTFLAHSCVTWFYAYTILSLLSWYRDHWTPTGLKQRKTQRFMGLYFASTAYIVFSFSLLGFLSFKGYIDYDNPYFYPIIFWDFFALAYHMLFTLYGWKYLIYNPVKKFLEHIF